MKKLDKPDDAMRLMVVTHPDALYQCGAWFDLSTVYCGVCERCKREKEPR